MKEKDIINDIISNIEKIDFLEIFETIRPVLICYIASRTIGDYVLNRRHKNSNYLKVYIPEEVNKKLKNIDDVDIEKVCSLKYANQIRIFSNTMMQNFKEKDLQNFYNNLNDLSIENIKKKKSFIHNYSTIGYYDTDVNTIYITDKYVDTTIYHELLHMASSIIIDEKNIRTGFHYITTHGHIGIGLNEGYTYLLTKRYFTYNKNSGYNYQLNIAETLERIIGKNQMESLYLNANIYGLINELRKYEDEKSIMEFIYNLDFITDVSGRQRRTFLGKKYLEESISNTSNFLIKCYLKKKKEEFDTRKISYEELENSIFDYINEFDKELKIGKEKYKYIREEMLLNTLNNIFEINTNKSEKKFF